MNNALTLPSPTEVGEGSKSVAPPQAALLRGRGLWAAFFLYRVGCSVHTQDVVGYLGNRRADLQADLAA
jgi:hypothetical protein